MSDVNDTVTYRDIPGYPGYRVGDDGSVWTSLSTGCISRITETWREKTRCKQPRNYRSVTLNKWQDNKRVRKTYMIHRLVLEAFVGPRPDGMECRHLNSDPSDNRLVNITWGTPEENQQDVEDAGHYQRGVTHHRCKITEEAVVQLRTRVAAGETLRSVAAELGISESHACGIVKRRFWSHVP